MDGHRQIEGRQAEAVIASNRTSHVCWLGYGDGVGSMTWRVWLWDMLQPQMYVVRQVLPCIRHVGE